MRKTGWPFKLVKTWRSDERRRHEASENMAFTTALRERLIDAMKGVFGKDQRRIDHVLKVLEYAELHPDDRRPGLRIGGGDRGPPA